MSAVVDPPPRWLAPELHVLVGTPLSLTSSTDGATLAHEIAHVHVRDRERLSGLLSALQQLTQLAQTDARTWERHVAFLWPAAASKLITKRNRVLPRASANVIGLIVAIQTVDDINSLTHLQHGLGGDDHTSAPVPVSFSLGHNSAIVRAALDGIVAISTTPPTNDRMTPAQTFRVANVSGLGYTVQCVQLLEKLAELADRDVVISDFPRLDVPVAEQNAAQIVHSLHRVFARRRPGGHATVLRIKLSHYLPDRMAAMLFSVIGANTSVQELRLSLGHPVRVAAGPTVAQWFAFALFSRESHHKIRRLVLQLAPQDPRLHQSIHDVIQAEDPVATLYPQFADSVAQYTNERLTASAFVLFAPENANGATSEHCTGHRHEGLRIISETAEWWSVLLPAWGRAWVRKADAVVTTRDLSTAGDEIRRLILHIAVGVHSSEELTRSLSWLRLVGSGTTAVSLSCDAWIVHRVGQMTPRPVLLDWSDALTAFSNVQKLSLAHLQVGSMRPLINWISSADCNLRHLRLRNVWTHEVGAGVPALLDLLGDKHHPIAKTLKSLVVEASQPGQPQTEIVAAALRMLATNTQLGSFELCVRAHVDQSVAPIDSAAVRAAFAAHDNTPLKTYEPRRLALLSVVTQSSGGLLLSLDTSILCSIFDFAGLRHRRSVKFHVFES